MLCVPAPCGAFRLQRLHSTLDFATGRCPCECIFTCLSKPKLRPGRMLCGVQHNRDHFRTLIWDTVRCLRAGPTTDLALHGTHYATLLVQPPCSRPTRALPVTVGDRWPSLHGSALWSLISGWPMLGVALLLHSYAILYHPSLALSRHPSHCPHSVPYCWQSSLWWNANPKLPLPHLALADHDLRFPLVRPCTHQWRARHMEGGKWVGWTGTHIVLALWYRP